MAKNKTKAVGQEHHVYKDNGELAGLWTIDGHEVRKVFGVSRFWEGCDEIIRLYKEIHPNEFDQALYENMDSKLNNKTATGANDSGSFRMALQVPYNLYLTLIDYEPRIFRDKKMRQSFMKRYPVLSSVTKV